MWSYLLGAIGITGLIIARTRPRLGWWFNIAAQVAWVWFAVDTRQWGFLAMSAGYSYAYVRLLIAAYRPKPVTPETVIPDTYTVDSGRSDH